MIAMSITTKIAQTLSVLMSVSVRTLFISKTVNVMTSMNVILNPVCSMLSVITSVEVSIAHAKRDIK